jgi:hypothetical protein
MLTSAFRIAGRKCGSSPGRASAAKVTVAVSNEVSPGSLRGASATSWPANGRLVRDAGAAL